MNMGNSESSPPSEMHRTWRIDPEIQRKLDEASKQEELLSKWFGDPEVLADPVALQTRAIELAIPIDLQKEKVRTLIRSLLVPDDWQAALVDRPWRRAKTYAQAFGLMDEYQAEVQALNDIRLGDVDFVDEFIPLMYIDGIITNESLVESAFIRALNLHGASREVPPDMYEQFSSIRGTDLFSRYGMIGAKALIANEAEPNGHIFDHQKFLDFFEVSSTVIESLTKDVLQKLFADQDAYKKILSIALFMVRRGLTPEDAINTVGEQKVMTARDRAMQEGAFSAALMWSWTFQLPDQDARAAIREQLLRSVNATKGTALESAMDPEYLPSIEDFKAFKDSSNRWIANRSSVADDSERATSDPSHQWREFVEQPGFAKFEILTREYVHEFANYLATQAKALHRTEKHPLRIVEVGAGNGRMAHFIREELARQKNRSIEYIATEPGYWRGQDNTGIYYPIIPLDAEEALTTYRPDVVIMSWMPPEQDFTPLFREAKVSEYILIGVDRHEPGIVGMPESWESQGGYLRTPHPSFEQYQLNKNSPYSRGLVSSTVSFVKESSNEAPPVP
jgi:hypothetical protein